MSLAAVPAHALLDGVRMANPESWKIRATRMTSVRTLKSGARREQVVLQPPDLPEVAYRGGFEIAWKNLKPGTERDRIRLLLARAGSHQLILWRQEARAWLGDSARVNFSMPRAWKLAVDGVPTPPGIQATSLDPVFRVGVDGAPLAFTLQPAATFDSGLPGPGDVWVREGGPEIKLGTPVPAGERLYALIVPVYTVIQDSETSEQVLTRPNLEPQTIRMLEV